MDLKRNGLHLWVNTIEFNNQTKLQFRDNDITVIVGPNNAGKSASLREIHSKIINNRTPGVVVADVILGKRGSIDDVLAWLGSTCRKQADNPSNPAFLGLGSRTTHLDITQTWVANASFGSLGKQLSCYLTAEARLQAANPPKNIALTKDPLTHPIHYLQADDELESRVSRYFKEAFGLDLIVHRNAGNEVPLHCGLKPQMQPGEDRVFGKAGVPSYSSITGRWIAKLCGCSAACNRCGSTGCLN